MLAKIVVCLVCMWFTCIFQAVFMICPGASLDYHTPYSTGDPNTETGESASPLTLLMRAPFRIIPVTFVPTPGRPEKQGWKMSAEKERE